jgi:Bacteriophage CI repressor helix-turn-helix domain
LKFSQEKNKEKFKSPILKRISVAFGGIGLKTIGERLGFTAGLITTWNQGTIPRGEDLIRISEMTGVSIHWLLTETGPKYVKDFSGAPIVIPSDPVNDLGCNLFRTLPKDKKDFALTMLEALHDEKPSRKEVASSQDDSDITMGSDRAEQAYPGRKLIRKTEGEAPRLSRKRK